MVSVIYFHSPVNKSVSVSDYTEVIMWKVMLITDVHVPLFRIQMNVLVAKALCAKYKLNIC